MKSPGEQAMIMLAYKQRNKVTLFFTEIKLPWFRQLINSMLYFSPGDWKPLIIIEKYKEMGLKVQ